MKTLLQEAMLEGLVQSYRNSTDPNLLALIDSINQGDRTALAPLSDYYRAKGEDGKADMFLWCWKIARWPEFMSKRPYADHPGWRFSCDEIKPQQPQCHIGGLDNWNQTGALDNTCCQTIFGSFELFYSRLWSKCPEHTARLMKELQ